MTSPCPFCTRIAALGPPAPEPHAVALPDAFPLSPGHTLVVPRRHVADLFQLSADEQAAIWRLVADVKAALERDREPKPDAFNIGVNVGSAAGQTVDHAHVHVIPRFRGDVADPRGGVRWVIPARAPYWNEKP